MHNVLKCRINLGVISFLPPPVQNVIEREWFKAVSNTVRVCLRGMIAEKSIKEK